MNRTRRSRLGSATQAAPQITAPTNRSIRRHPDKAAHLLRHPAAWATAYSPAGRRRRWAAMVRCPECHGGHLIYANSRDELGGVHTIACGRVWVVVDLVVSAIEAVPSAA